MTLLTETTTRPQPERKLQADDFRRQLQQEFIRRCKKNPRYSVRSFARALELDHSTLSQLMRGTRKFSRTMLIRLAAKLGMSPAETDRLLVHASKRPSETTEAGTVDYQQLSLDSYQIIADWYHYAIFELVTVRDFEPDPRWIGRRLNITSTEAQLACERLFRVGLLEKDEQGNWRQATPHITTTGNDFTATAFRKLQAGVLEGALRALEDVPMELRDQTSMTMALNTRRLPEAKKRIKDFRRALCEFLQQDADRDAVYQLGVSLFPLTRIENRKEGVEK